VWHSQWKPAYDQIVAEYPPPQAAVAHVLKYGEQQGMAAPRFYVSTAISSAGWNRDPDLQSPDDIPEVIEKNNRTSSLILEALVGNPNPLVSDTSMMVGFVLFRGILLRSNNRQLRMPRLAATKSGAKTRLSGQCHDLH
jgi:hypothetical protein